MQLKVKFMFILLGPKNDNIDYLEIGRCMGTLMTNKVIKIIYFYKHFSGENRLFVNGFKVRMVLLKSGFKTSNLKSKNFPFCVKEIIC